MEFTFSPWLGLVGASILGGAIGLQRQAQQKPAGFRTHLLVALGAAAFTAMGAHLHDTRIPSYVVVGVGFLGGGAIVRQGLSLHGLTTAASIWMAAAIGLSLGYANGFGLSIGVAATLITLFALSLSDDTVMRLFRIPRRATLRVTCLSPQGSTANVTQAIRDAHIDFESVTLVSITGNGSVEESSLLYDLQIARGRDLSGIVREVASVAGVTKVEAVDPAFAGPG